MSDLVFALHQVCSTNGTPGVGGTAFSRHEPVGWRGASSRDYVAGARNILHAKARMRELAHHRSPNARDRWHPQFNNHRPGSWPPAAPVQWRGFSEAIGAYQGEVMHKAEIQAAFWQKVNRCKTDSEAMRTADWTGLNAILNAIFAAFGGPGVQTGSKKAKPRYSSGPRR